MREKGVDVAFLRPVLWPHLCPILLEVRQTCPSYLGMNPRQSVCVGHAVEMLPAWQVGMTPGVGIRG